MMIMSEKFNSFIFVTVSTIWPVTIALELALFPDLDLIIGIKYLIGKNNKAKIIMQM